MGYYRSNHQATVSPCAPTYYLQTASMRAMHTWDDEATCRRCAAHLRQQGMECSVDKDDQGRWTLWLHAERDLIQGRTVVGEFLADPDSPRFAAPDRLQRQLEPPPATYLHENVDSVTPAPVASPTRYSPTMALIVITVAITLWSTYGAGDDAGSELSGNIAHLGWLTFTPLTPRGLDPNLLDTLLSGQIWRLVTPIFIHFTILHLLFNMLWLYNLGTLLERRLGGRHLVFLVVITGILSNTGEFMWQHLGTGPIAVFGGFSGVVYALFGYVWLRGRRDPWFGVRLDATTIGIMMVWFGLCWTGLMGPIANMAHTIGLLSGLAWAWLAIQVAQQRRLRRRS